MLKEDPPPSRHEVSKRIGCHVVTLRRRSPKLFTLIEERFSNYRAQLYDKEKIKSSLIAAKEENPPPSSTSIAKRLGCSRGFLKLHFPEDCKIISERYAESRKVFEDIDGTRDKLLALQAETPPLSMRQCTERLGCQSQQLNRFFPEITRAIKIKYYKHRRMQSRRRRERRYKIIREMVTTLEAEQVVPSTYWIIKRLPNLKGLTSFELHAALRDMNLKSPIPKKIK
jgi:AraC-like DNA-binding protein